MAKVKLTQKQADEIERIKRIGFPGHWKEDGWFIERDEKINDLSFHQLTNAVFNGYEVGPDIKVGDFVDIGLFGINKIAEVTGIKGDAIAINGSDEYNEFKINRILTDGEKQKEKTRRWWAKHGRDVWRIGKDDILVCPQEQAYTVERISDGVVAFKEGSDKHMWEIKSGYKVVCFAEDRKDA